ncbi:MAG: hypothetical protein AAFV46_05265, partial [Cyanobacteria bacterium J06635_11]
MVSPLQTWKHPESKRLWPLLGGLSVLAHIGAMGFSLPYLLELMQPPGDRTAAIPIEMVVVDPDQQPATPANNQTDNQTSVTSSDNRVAKTNPADFAPSEPKAATNNVARPSAIRSATNSEATSVQPSATTAPSESNTTEAASNALDNDVARAAPSGPTEPSTSNDATDSS